MALKSIFGEELIDLLWFEVDVKIMTAEQEEQEHGMALFYVWGAGELFRPCWGLITTHAYLYTPFYTHTYL